MLLLSSKWRILLRVLEKKLSTQRTSCPLLRSRSHRCDPRNPAPPVTRMRFDIPLPLAPLYKVHIGELHSLPKSVAVVHPMSGKQGVMVKVSNSDGFASPGVHTIYLD